MTSSEVQARSNASENASLYFVALPLFSSTPYWLRSDKFRDSSSSATSLCSGSLSHGRLVGAADDSTCNVEWPSFTRTSSSSLASFPAHLATHLRKTVMSSSQSFTSDGLPLRISVSLPLRWRRNPEAILPSNEFCFTVPSVASIASSLSTIPAADLKDRRGIPTQATGDSEQIVHNFVGVNSGLRTQVISAFQHLTSEFRKMQRRNSDQSKWKNDQLQASAVAVIGKEASTTIGKGRNRAIQTSKHLTAGAIAAMVSRTIVAPLERLKLEYLVRGATGNVMEIVRGILLTEGVKGFWKGNGVNLLRTAPFKSVNFYAYDAYRSQLLKWGKRNEVSNIERLAAGAVAGVTATILCFPLDTLRTLVVASGGEAVGGLRGCCSHLIQTEGFFALYKGLLPAVVSMAPSGAVFYGVYDILKTTYLNSPEGKAMIKARERRAAERSENASNELELGPFRTLLYGALAGACSETVTYPLEVVRRAQQLQHAMDKRSMIGTMQFLMAKGGIGAFYAGIFPSTMQVLPSAALSYFVYESVKIAFQIP